MKHWTDPCSMFQALAILGSLALHACPYARAAIDSEEAWHLTPIAEGAPAAFRPSSQGFYHSGTDSTYLLACDANLDAWLLVYHHAANIWHSPKRVAGELHDSNYHNYPVLAQSADGALHVFIARGHIAHTRSPPNLGWQLDWSSEKAMTRADGALLNGSYPLPAVARDGTFYLFYRASATGVPHSHPIRYIKSGDHGRSWSEPQDLIAHVPAREDLSSNIYLMEARLVPASQGYPERILLSWLNAGPGPSGKGGYNTARKDVFFAWMSVSSDRLFSADDTSLGTVIDNQLADTHCKAYDSGPLKAKRTVNSFVLNHLTDDGHYLVAFKDNGRGRIAVGRWNGQRWEDATVAPSSYPARVMEIEKTGPQEFLLYVMGGDTADPRQLEIYKTRDGGRSWELFHRMASPRHSFQLLSLIDNYHPEIRLIAHSFRKENRWAVVGNAPIAPPKSLVGQAPPRKSNENPASQSKIRQ